MLAAFCLPLSAFAMVGLSMRQRTSVVSLKQVYNDEGGRQNAEGGKRRCLLPSAFRFPPSPFSGYL
jgi:hypothetical protein